MADRPRPKAFCNEIRRSNVKGNRKISITKKEQKINCSFFVLGLDIWGKVCYNINMEIYLRRENNRCYAQCEKIGKYYYYSCGDKEAEAKAIKRAHGQAPSIKKFINNYWNMQKDFDPKK
ncbi:hypothetical protein KAU34_10475 [candidate division WOR-3 bacterium]|nr:hypothetical protein [candidate division WOR-3 bacterium]